MVAGDGEGGDAKAEAALGGEFAAELDPEVLTDEWIAAAGALVIFMTAINELTLSALLWSAGNETIGVQIFSLQYEGNSTAAAALSGDRPPSSSAT